MGQARARKQRFFSEHKFCCFCGGKELATTIDHQPGRLFFNNRQSPLEYQFPACHFCNSLTKESEQALRLVTTPKDFDDANLKIWLKTVRYFQQTDPALIRSLDMTTREKRNISKRFKISKPLGHRFDDIPMVKLEPELWRPHLENVGRKLMLALHYQAFGVPLSANGKIRLIHRTNTDMKPMAELFQGVLDRLVIPIAQGKEVGEQFAIRFGIAKDVRVAAWAIHLHQRFFFFGITVDNQDWMKVASVDEFGQEFGAFDAN